MKPVAITFLFGIFSIISKTFCFNLDIANPIVKAGNSLSSFGFAVAGHLNDHKGKG